MLSSRYIFRLSVPEKAPIPISVVFNVSLIDLTPELANAFLPISLTLFKETDFKLGVFARLLSPIYATFSKLI